MAPSQASRISAVRGSTRDRRAEIKGDLDHRGACFFRGLLAVLHQTGRRGLLVVLDEVETIQRVRADSREKSLNALRQLIDDLDSRIYPGLYVVVTGTPQFFDGPRASSACPRPCDLPGSQPRPRRLDKVDAHADYDPTQHFELIVSAAELTPEERAAAGLPAPSVDDIPLDLP